MDSDFKTDENSTAEVSALLAPPPTPQLQEYFKKLITSRGCNGIEVKHNGTTGKGVYANSEFQEEELIMKDEILVGIQHSSNKMDCLVCSFCFRFVGSIEKQIGRKLYFKNHLGLSGCCDEDEYMKYNGNEEQCGGSSSTLPEGVVSSLMSGELALPLTDKFPLPSPLSCPGGCQEAFYCSESCAEADWESSHSLLCTGERSESVSREALGEFIKHANDTNDIFVLAAKAIAFTILRYRKLKAAHVNKKAKQSEPNQSLLLEAWKPVSLGYKRRWWDCIALPDDVDPSDEGAFRMQIKNLAYTSLELLKSAIFDKECEALFSLEIYGNIIGMFELNNLDLVVASPVEDYFLYIDDLPDAEKEEAEDITRPFLDALGDEYSDCCQGTAFFPLQSCMNHSCCPNAKAFKREEDRDGQAVIIALRHISKNEEVTISYIDEELPYKERQTLLADYGFSCKCSKCLEDSSSV
ncbi:PREDICTED: histone-lysine N-methyltransferase ATXR2-like isoform X1 [Camelina sativa]|uniref:Histone-lysine N-methyltransferase ATXR2-like isoform X1 n=2 Tax=Camelina sativa TaxID=90675 RepID=A0ABM0W6N3_CAMSA|nr:PREDICTED: histone-lysine N-methyltransferase ATXR2-like isoform X1 [Camelina sativa]